MSAPPIDTASGFRLSPSQRRLFRLQRRDPSFPQRAACVVSIKGDLDVARLTAAFEATARRHEILRSRFCLSPGAPEPVQLVEDPVVTVRRTVIQAEPHELLRRALRVPVKAGGPVVDVSLSRLSDREHQMVIEVPSLSADRASLGILVRELEHAYSNDEEAATGPEAIQYADVAEWKNQVFVSEEGKPGRELWRRATSELLVAHRLPAQDLSEIEAEFDLRTRAVELPLDDLRRLAAAWQVPLQGLLLASWHVFVARITGRADSVVGVGLDGRGYCELTTALGLFATQVPVVVSLPETLSFLDAVRRALQAREEAETWHECFSWDATSSAIPFGFEWRDPQVLAGAGVTMSLLGVSVCSDRSDVKLVGSGGDDSPTLELEYDAGRISSAAAERIGARFANLVSMAVCVPEAPIGSLELLPPAEGVTSLGEPEAPAGVDSSPAWVPLPRRVERQASVAPSTVAVTFREEALTYRQLDAESRELAELLRQRGVVAEDRVAILLEPSHEFILASLAVMKAGAAFVPLDPGCPTRRLAAVFRDSGARVLLTHSALRAALPSVRIDVVCVDDLAAQDAASDPVSASIDLDQAACVLYASDADGVPRGTVVLHRGLVHSFDGCARSYGLANRRGTLVHSALDRFETIFSLFAPLAVGKACRILPRSGRTSTLESAMRDGVDVGLLHVNAHHLDVLSQILESQGFAQQARALVVSGADVSAASLAVWRRHSQDTALFREYGAAETSGGSCCCEVGETSGRSGPVPIGRPLGDARVYLLDRWLNPVAPGLAGELFVGGAGVARGYLCRPELTARDFVPDPFGAAGGRLFRTGDVCRWGPDGQLELLRRADRRVEIAGNRIEPGEIEAALVEHLQIRECVVHCREPEPGLRRLIAYVVPEVDAPAISGLRGFLEKRLPAHLLPTALVVLDAVPRRPNGAVDYDALPAPPGLRPQLDVSYESPRTELEHRLAALWASQLDLDRVGVHDPFGDLGGHLLEALRLVTAVSTELGRSIPLDLLFAHPTVASLAEAVEQLPANGRGAASSKVGDRKPVSGSVMQSISPFLQIEQRPLLPLVATGKLATVDAAALGYLPLSFLRHTGLDRAEFIQGFCDDLPVFSSILETGLGRIAAILLPRFEGELYRNEADLVKVAAEALEMAGQIGARAVSLSGLIASASNCGRSIASSIHGRGDLPCITTGHATTSAANLLSIRAVLDEAGRSIEDERVGFFGVGTVGRATLRLMLHCLPHPAEILLCDVYDKLELLDEVRREIVEDLGFRGDVQLIGSGAEAPVELCRASLILSTTNVADILDVERLEPGTLIVDDSAPSCLCVDDAVRRFRERGDILFTEGGVVGPPEPIQRLFFLPKAAEQFVTPEQVDALANHDPRRIRGCTFSSLLTARFEELGPTVGPVDLDTCQRHLTALTDLGFGRAKLRFDYFTPDEESIHRFRARFGRNARDGRKTGSSRPQSGITKRVAPPPDE